MIDSSLIEKIVAELRAKIPQDFGREAEKNTRAALQGIFDRLKLVSREEIEVQEALLARTRARLQELEKKVAELEEKLNKK
ncbi:MAG: accessory factor UbiK family protein [Gammaproteobacteria bacterium]|nr:accessory factor UbiK family protein [Gammaproteobacteria bacterium]